MVKVSKYSKEILLQAISSLSKKVYLLFYDLNLKDFDDVVPKLNISLDNIETRIIKIHNEDCLVVFCYLNSKKLHLLIAEFDSLDIGEFELSEYQDEQGVINSINYSSSNRDNKIYKSIYVNKDERIIQLYNFF